MRKKTLIIITLIAAFQFSCESWLELIPPQGLIRDEFWQTRQDVDAVVMGIYEQFGGMNDQLFRYGEIRADMITNDYNVGGDEQKIMEGIIYPDNWLCNWSAFYEVINYCNEVIKNAPEVQKIDKNFTEFHLQGYLAEAHFMRNLAYFYLVRIFRDVPYITDPTETDDSEFYPTKLDGNLILDSLMTDLQEYRKYATLDGYQTLEQLKGRVTRAAYDALIADIALWTFDYETVISHVDSILNSKQDFVLLEDDQWYELYYPGNSAESIFEFQFDTERSQNNALYGMTNYYGHNYDPSLKAIEMFVESNSPETVRGIDATVKKYGEDDYIIWKYVGRTDDGESFRPGFEQSSANWIIYRLADVILMKAEALSQLGRYSEAYDHIDLIRSRALLPMPQIGESASAYEDVIMNERALEFAYEGKRWFDLMRMGRRNDFARKSKLIEIIIQNVPSTQKRILQVKLANPLGWYLPVYEGELERNKNLVQNPYYKN